MGKSVAEIVKDRLLEKIESKQVLPWHKPWQSSEAINYVTRKPYQGVNKLLLDGGEYLTFKQIEASGGHVNRGAKGNMVVFYKEVETKEGELSVNPDKENKRVLRYYNVFHIQDTIGIESKLEIKMEQRQDAPEEQREKLVGIVEGYKNKPAIQHAAGGRAYYSPGTDYIRMPLKEQFSKETEYYSTLIHELAHSTGSKDRLNREGVAEAAGMANRQKYSKEELIAEISSAGLMLKAGVTETFDNSEAYIRGWANYIRGEKANAIISAASQADKAINYIVGEKVLELEQKTEKLGKVENVKASTRVSVKAIEEQCRDNFNNTTNEGFKKKMVSVLEVTAQIKDKTQRLDFLVKDGHVDMRGIIYKLKNIQNREQLKAKDMGIER